MDVKALLEHFKADITCSICLGYFTDPVTVKCGHSFCTRCLFQCENEADAEFTCPECRQVIQISDLVPNKNLQNLSLMGSIIRPHLLQSMNICVQHWEKEKLFCEEDQRLLCESCSLAPEHKDHQVFPLDRAVDKCKDKIQETWGNLLDKKEKFQRQLNNETEKEARCKEDLHVLKLSVISEYEKMHIFLRDEKHVQMLKLDLEVKENLAKFNKSKTKLSQQIQNLQQMTLEVQKNLDKGPLEMLQAMKNTQERTEALLLQDPECAFPNRIAFQITGMSEILVSFQRDITLDPETADPQLTLSEDLKSVKYVDVPQDQTGNHKKFSHALRVLGAQRFTSGKHYWEVEVGDKTGWEVGICKESVNRKDDANFSLPLISLPGEIMSPGDRAKMAVRKQQDGGEEAARWR
ncbi:probable E3 ubiquitin-protein ligase TRIML1 [Dromiciops gliroides]|uniref:probable E3 ubiquitin-protein ligase TRIML1 n=1 Tax=Dromiciops gliroides TaxID=33562 RepID=UPI001CC7D47F|nr:probable E3 ubiquitin-protein ligase TRIML1 [Dromiciops gliroides]